MHRRLALPYIRGEALEIPYAARRPITRGSYLGPPPMTTAPTLPEIADQLRALLAGARNRLDVSTWAHQWLTADDPNIDDDVAWRALERIGGADLPVGEADYLYHETDFHYWLDEVDSAIEARR